MHAEAGAYRNNCAFHCLAHVWLSQDEKSIRKLFEKYPVFSEIMINFDDYYGLNGKLDIDNFIALTNKFSHPADREILFGQVFRTLLQKKYSHSKNNEIKSELKNGQLISDEIIGQFANEMGASLFFHSDVSSDFDLNFPLNKPDWKMEIFHTPKGGGHYNFSYGKDVSYLDEFHNQQYYPMNQYNQRLPKGNTFLHKATDLVGIDKQEAQIKKTVQEQFRFLMEDKENKRPGIRK